VLYYLSTTVNPVLYHIMSHKFREAFKVWMWINWLYSPCCSCQWGETMSLNCSHKRAYCPSLRRDMSRGILWRNAPLRSVSSFSGGRKPERRSGTFFPAIGITSPSLRPSFGLQYVPEPVCFYKDSTVQLGDEELASGDWREGEVLFPL
jgi:hypothetical protein